MNFEPPADNMDKSRNMKSGEQPKPGGGYYPKSRPFQKPNTGSPLLRTPSSNTALASNTYTPLEGSSQQFNRPPVYNRLGGWNRNNNSTNNVNNQWKYNRKRQHEGYNGPIGNKRWNNKKAPYFTNQANQQSSSVQSRLNRHRNPEPFSDKTEISISNELHKPDVGNHNLETTQFNHQLDDSDVDNISDITVEVVNNIRPSNFEEQGPARFKMILDQKTQTAIRLIQSKRKEKQVIFPYPVTPNVTAISLHERFGLL